ncbi:MAG: M67 family metallopeptidase [Dehalococcoidia bacterium]
MALLLPRGMIDDMIAHARQDTPNECCGIIAGKDGRPTQLYRMRNVAEAAYLPYRYEMDGKALLGLIRELDSRDEEFHVIYHSHTATEGYPSPTDVRFAANWPDPYYVLVSLMDEQPVVRAFRIVDGEVSEESLEVG